MNPDVQIPKNISTVLEKIAKFMKANEMFWYDEKTMGD